MEEQWGLWMKKYKLDETVDYDKKNEIEKAYQKFEDNIKKNYFESSSLNLINPFNYFKFRDFSTAYSRDNDSCFFAQYMKSINDLEDVKNDNDKINLKNKIIKSSETLQDKFMTSLEAMNSTISNLNNNLLDDNTEQNKTYDDCQNDIKNKLEIMSAICDGFKGNIQIIEDSMHNDKRVLNAKKFKYVSDITKNLHLINYFYSLKIYGFYELEIDIEKDWLGIFTTIFIGALEIAGGTFLLWATGGQIGSEFINEGMSDIKYGFDCLI